MKLPGNALGISDILQYRLCPMRFLYGMQRHDAGDPPESWSPANAYGDAIHHAFKEIAKGADVEEALSAAYRLQRAFLDPEDFDMLRRDIGIYLMRDELGVRTVLAEDEIRVPLFRYDGEQIFFRARIDRLYQSLSDESRFFHRDYKSSKWEKSQDEVDADPQLWAYNWSLHEAYPEIETLVQTYDQLRFGEVETSKNDDQRESIRLWLIEAVTDIIEAIEPLEPTFNEWCPWCPIKMDCSEIPRLSRWALTRIDELAPRRPKTLKDGSPGKQLLPPEVDVGRLDDYTAVLADVTLARKTLDAFEKEVKSAIKEAPSDRRLELGFEVRTKSARTNTPNDLRRIHEELGDDFYQVVGLTQARVDRALESDDPRRVAIEENTQKSDGAEWVQAIPDSRLPK